MIHVMLFLVINFCSFTLVFHEVIIIIIPYFKKISGGKCLSTFGLKMFFFVHKLITKKQLDHDFQGIWDF